MKRILSIALLLALALTALAGCGGKTNQDKDAPITRLEQLAEPGRKIGVGIGTGEDAAVREAFPEAEVELFNDGLMGYAAVADGSLDAFCFSKRNMEVAIQNGRTGVRLLEETVGEGDRVAVGLSPKSDIPDLKGKIDAFIAEIKADGTLDDMYKRWAVDFNEVMPDIAVPEHAETRLRVGTIGLVVPFSYYAGTELTGHDIELARRFAAWLGAELELKVYDYTGLIAAAQSGDVDCIMAELYVTPERAEAIPFSETLFTVELGVMVRDEGATAEKAAAAAVSGGFTRLDELAGKRIGVMTGSIQDGQVAERFPDSERLYFSSMPDMLTALRANKIDGFACPEALVRHMMTEAPDLDYLKEWIGEGVQIGAVFPKTEAGQALCDQFNAFIREMQTGGVYEEIQNTWFGADESKRAIPDLYTLPGPNGTLRMAADTSVAPFIYIKDGQPVGIDIDLVVRFCKEYGYGLEVVPMDFSGVLASVAAGKADFACCGIAYTPERAESALFSETYYESKTVMAVLKNAGGAQTAAGGQRTLADFAHAKIGVATGTNFPDILAEYLPEAEVLYFNTTADQINALKSGKIAAFMEDDPVARNMIAEDDALTIFPEEVGHFDFAFAFTKNERGNALCEELSDYIRALKADGTLEQLQSKWFNSADLGALESTEYRALPATNGTLRVVTSEYPPFCLSVEGFYSGYDIELLAMFCRDNGYAMEIHDYGFDGGLPAVQSGKSDVACSGISITEERMETMYFSEPNYSGGAALVVRKGDAAQANIAALQGATIGVQTGTTHDELVKAQLPDATILYYNTYADLLAALSDGKIDAFPASELTLRPMLTEYPQLRIVDGLALMTAEMGFVAQKTPEGRALCDEFSAWFDEINASGEMDAILGKWTEAPDSERTVLDWTALPAEKGVLHMATEGGFPPYEYYLDNKLVGIEIDLVARFCEARGYGLEITDMSFESVLPSVSTGKSDFAAAGISITAVREESISFTKPYFTEKVLLVTMEAEEKTAEGGSFWASVRDSFEKTFIRESRWKLFVQGIGTTLLITVLSIVFGTALGFGVYLLCRGGNIVANGVTRFFVWLVHGMPMVVLLMILYYIIFGKVAISGTVVSIIGFTLVFGASMFGMLRSGVGAVEKGQMEAAYALGYTDNRAFFRVILPQALPHFFPAYKGEITATIKATAIVGYVAVQDLTKMGDIVRSRTYEAFFPLIAVAIIYFILAGILTAVVNRLGVFVDPRRRKNEDVLKGVTVK